MYGTDHSKPYFLILCIVVKRRKYGLFGTPEQQDRDQQGRMGHSSIILDGFAYGRAAKTNQAAYYRCRLRRRGCPGRITVYSNGRTKVVCEHTCATNLL